MTQQQSACLLSLRSPSFTLLMRFSRANKAKLPLDVKIVCRSRRFQCGTETENRVGEKRTELSGLVGGTEKRDRRRRNQLKNIILRKEREENCAFCVNIPQL
mmetsp:Transcript_21557/g.31316  ORF Transcript_21557/g.31316 Transcript_21557/m.31316 type:complete len:102 (+) Transcript_21557:549-854(+)